MPLCWCLSIGFEKDFLVFILLSKIRFANLFIFVGFLVGMMKWNVIFTKKECFFVL